MRAAFIAAPLIGTILFLSSLLFIVNLSKYETSQVSYSVSDAYHNRITSLLEMYRSDMAAVFSVGLSRAIEKFLLSQCWTSPPFGMQLQAPWSEANEQTQRLQFCRQLNSLAQSSVCSINPNYGLKNWLSYLNETVSFEGITFTPANPAEFTRLTETTSSFQVNCDLIQDPTQCRSYSCTWSPPPEGQVAGGRCSGGMRNTQGNAVCAAFISTDTFDCDAFARGDLKCAGNLPGCDSGVFYVKANVQDPTVYFYLPRVSATDGAGNIVRSGALSDKDFYVPVNFPLFKYYDAAYEYAKEIMLDVQAGYCVGDSADCSKKSAGAAVELEPEPQQNRDGRQGGEGRPQQGSNTALTGEAGQQSNSESGRDFTEAFNKARRKASAKLVVRTILPVAQSVEEMFPELHLEFSTSSDYQALLDRSSFVPSYNLLGNDGQSLASAFEGSLSPFKAACKEENCLAGSDGQVYTGAYAPSLYLPTRIVDDSSVYRANPDKPNDFCFSPNWVTSAQR